MSKTPQLVGDLGLVREARAPVTQAKSGKGAQMDESIIGPTDHLPDGAVLILTAEHVMRAKGTILVGRIECDELRVGDRVVAVTDKPICKGVACAVDRWIELSQVAHRGDEVGVMVRGWADFPVGPGTRLYLVPRSGGK
jgi:translation elongation factor EF-Tu-like GTPase